MHIDWVSTAVIGAAAFGMVNVIDSHLITKRMPSFQAYLFVVGVLILLFSILLAVLFPLPKGIGFFPLIMSILSGAIRTASVVIMLHVMKKEEVSLVVPITNIYPIIVAFIAVPVLGETINLMQWVAIIIVVLGVLLASVRLDSRSHLAWLGKPLILLIGSSVLMAVSDVMAKYALSYVSSWNMYWISHLCIAGAFLSISCRPWVVKGLMNSPQRNSAIIIAIFNEITAVTSLVLFYWSMQRGPVSLVSAIFSSRPIFVFLYALLISRFSNMLLERRGGGEALVLRFIATAMIVGGIVIMYLTKGSISG